MIKILFNSPEFLLFFLPLVFFGFALVKRYGNVNATPLYLLFWSICFYSWHDFNLVFVILGSILLNSIFCAFIERANKKQFKIFILISAVVVNLLILGYFKYANFFLEQFSYFFSIEHRILHIALPLAISFFTFQQIALLSDVYQGITKRPTIFNHALYISFFPQLIAGPIVHHSDLMPQFKKVLKNRTIDAQDISVGCSLICLGLFKKVILVAEFQPTADKLFSFALLGGQPTLIESWIGVLCFSLQIYFDFSAYSDIAIGTARLFGIILPINFNSPYKSKNISEFWRRWHITLSKFLFKYLYIPIGGNKKGTRITFRNLFIVMILGGLWHGANWTFVLWGAAHGTLLVCHKIYRKIFIKNKFKKQNSIFQDFVNIATTFFFVTFIWVLFRAENLNEAQAIYRGLLGYNGFVLPNHYENYLSGISHVHLNLGLTFDNMYLFGGGWQLLTVVFWVFFVLISPNIYSILKPLQPALHIEDISSTKLTHLRKVIVHFPKLIGFCIGLISIFIILRVLRGSPGEFIYFQF